MTRVLRIVMPDTIPVTILCRQHSDDGAWYAVARLILRYKHNPHCPSPYKVYMVGRRKGRINYDINDIIGHGKTLDEAIENALKEKGVHEAHTQGRQGTVD